MILYKSIISMPWLLWITAGCQLQPQETQTSSLRVFTLPGNPLPTEEEKKKEQEKVDDAPYVLLQVSWKGRPLRADDSNVSLRFYRKNEVEPYLSTTWEALREKAVDLGGTPDLQGALFRSESNVLLRSLDIGPVSTMGHVEARMSGEGSPTYIARQVLVRPINSSLLELNLELY